MRIDRSPLLRSAPSAARTAALTPAHSQRERAVAVDTFRPFSIDGVTTDPATGGRPDFAQGDTNACGTVALAIALHRLGMDVPVTDIDRAIRNFDLYTPVPAILDYARGQGLQAQVYNQGSFEGLQRDLAAGRQVLVLTDVGGYGANGDLQPGGKNDLATHWMVVTAAFEQHGERYVSYMNPWGTKETLPYAQFEALWRDVHALNMPTGYDRTYVLIDRPGAQALPPSNAQSLTAINNATGGVSNVVNGFADLMRGDLLGGLGRMGRGVVETVTGGIGTLARAVGGLFGGLFGPH